MADEAVAYDRKVLTNVLAYHQRLDISRCQCGWAELGQSHPEHVADVYERSVPDPCDPPALRALMRMDYATFQAWTDRVFSAEPGESIPEYQERVVAALDQLAEDEEPGDG